MLKSWDHPLVLMSSFAVAPLRENGVWQAKNQALRAGRDVGTVGGPLIKLEILKETRCHLARRTLFAFTIGRGWEGIDMLRESVDTSRPAANPQPANQREGSASANVQSLNTNR
jgi:hypothetical protein